MSFFFVFLVSWLNSKGLFADLKFELFNIINPTLSILVSLLLVSTLFMNDVLKVTTALHSSVSFGFFFLRQDKSKCGYSLTWSWKSMFDYSIKNRTSQSNCLSVSWKSHVYRGSFITNTKLERVQLSFFYIDWLQLQKSIAKFNFSVKCLRLLIFLSLPRGRSLWVEGNLISNFETCPSFGLYLILDKFPSLSSTDPSWSSNWIISVPNSNE